MTKGKFKPVAVDEDGKKPAASSKKRLLVVLVVIFILAVVVVAVAIGIYMVLNQGSEKEPGREGESSGMDLRPKTDGAKTAIVFSQGKNETYDSYVTSIQEYLNRYDNEQIEVEFEDLTTQTTPCDDSPQVNGVCYFELSRLGNECVSQTAFGYEDGTPCVLITLDKMEGWVPEDYNTSAVPEEIKDVYTPGHITVTCEGETANDTASMGPVEFYPPEGLPFYYYQTYEGEEPMPMAMQPAVFARFTNPTPNTLLKVTCQAWAKDLEDGSIEFDLMVN